MEVNVTKSFFQTKVITRISLLIAISIVLSKFLGIMLPIAGFPSVRISFGHVPIIICSILYGPKAGFVCGFLSDYLGSLLGSNSSAFIPGLGVLFSISSGLVGMLPAFVLTYIRKDYKTLELIVTAFFTIALLVILIIKNKMNLITVSGTIILLFFVFFIIPKIISRSFNNKNKIENFNRIYFAVAITRIITSVFLNTFFISILFDQSFLIFLPARIVSNFIMIPLLSFVSTIILVLIQNHRL